MAKAFGGLGATIIDTVADLPSASASLEGLMYYQKDTNELKICDGSRWISMLDTDAPSGMQLVQPTSVSGATHSNGLITFSNSGSIAVDGVFSSTFDAYKVVTWLYTASSSVTNGIFKLRAAGTAASSSYYSRMWYYTVSGGGFTTAVSNNAASLDWMFYGGNYGGVCYLDLMQPFGVTNTHMMWNSNIWTTADNASFYGSSTHISAASYDGFQVTSTTNMTGNMRVYGLRNNV